MTLKSLGLFAFGCLMLLSFLVPGCAEGLHLDKYYQYTHVPARSDPWTQIFPVYLDKNFGEADKIDIVQALDQWNYVFNGHAKFEVVNDHFDMEMISLRAAVKRNAFLIFKITADNPLTKDADGIVDKEPNGVPHGTSLGFTAHVCSHKVYIVRERLHNGDVYYVVMHELGHALCANHTADGLMSPHFSREKFRCVDYSAVMQVAQAQKWSLGDLNYCKPSQSAQGSSRLITRDERSGEDQKSLDPPVDIVGR